jgi:hypothetical protein
LDRHVSDADKIRAATVRVRRSPNRNGDLHQMESTQKNRLAPNRA